MSGLESWIQRDRRPRDLRANVLRALVVAAAFSVPWSAVSLFVSIFVAEGTIRDFLGALAASSAAVFVALVVELAYVFRDLRRVEEWQSSGEPAKQAAEILRLIIAAPMRWTSIGICAYLALWIPGYLWLLTGVAGSFALAALVVAGGVFVATPVAWPVGVFTKEIALAPALADIWSAHPDLELLQRAGKSLRFRAVLPVPLMTLSTGYGVGLLATGLESTTAQATLAVVGGAIFTAVFVAIMRFAVIEATVRPIDDLIAATAVAAAGDFGGRVQITSSDEFAVLGRAFNQMTTRLSTHEADMTASRARLFAASDHARLRVENALHASAQQYLTVAELRLGAVAQSVAGDATLAPLVADAQNDLANSLHELRELGQGLYPPTLVAEGLAPALMAAGQRAAVPTSVAGVGISRVDAAVEAAVYFCCSEALQNAAKHAGEGAAIAIELSERDRELTFSVSDDGCGYDTAQMGVSHGLQSMADRIAALDGTLSVTSTVGIGTTVSGRVPWVPDE